MDICNNMVQVYVELQDFKTALAMIARVYAISRKCLGEDHAETVAAKKKLTVLQSKA